jgi:hypothetical protein
VNPVLFLWVIFSFLDPDPGTQLNPDPIRIKNNAGSGAFMMMRYCTKVYLPVVYVNYGDGKVICDTGQKIALSMQTKHGQKVVQH